MFTEKDLLIELENQTRLLISSCLNFDRGYEFHGYEIAHRLRVLLYNSPTSTSLLRHIGSEGEMFLSTYIVDSPIRMIAADGKDKLPIFGLVETKLMTDGKFQSFYAYLKKSKNETWGLFDNWWDEEIVCSYMGRYSLTRKDLIKLFANKLGGSHFDKLIPKQVYSMYTVDSEVIGWTTKVGKSGILKLANSPFLASVRQIAHEFLESICKMGYCKSCIEDRYDSELYTYIGHGDRPLIFQPSIAAEQLGKEINYFGFKIGHSYKYVLFGLRNGIRKDNLEFGSLEYGIYLTDDGEISLIENHQLIKTEYKYFKDDVISFGLEFDNEKWRIIYMKNYSIISKSYTEPRLPLTLHIDMKSGASLPICIYDKNRKFDLLSRKKYYFDILRMS